MIRKEYLYKTYAKDEKTSLLFPFAEEDTDILRRSFIGASINVSIDAPKRLRYRIIPAFKLSLFNQSEREHYYQNEVDSYQSGKQKSKMMTKHGPARIHTKVPQNAKKEQTYIHLCWIYMWCGTIK